jgi:hypothetical protein
LASAISVGQVKLLFCLPSRYGRAPTEKLAYVEWFTDLKVTSGAAADLRVFKVSTATRARRRYASVIPVDLILQSTYLVPEFPSSAFNTDWKSDEVYQQAKSFFLSPFIRHYDFARFEDRLALPIEGDLD